MTTYTPMIEQYLKIKNENNDAILLFRLGDFYEMFFEDAQLASRELEIVLTARDGGPGNKIPMCGVPYHSVNNYIARLVAKGYNIAICDQVEDPKTANGIVKREVTRIITPGTILDDFMLDEGKNNYLAAVVYEAGILGFSYVDISTGDFMVTEEKTDHPLGWLNNEFQRILPAECLIVDDQSLPLWKEQYENRGVQLTPITEPISVESAATILLRHFGINSLDAFGIGSYQAGTQAAAAIISYLYATQKVRLNHIQKLSPYQSDRYMELDGFTRRNLELSSTMRENRKEGSLMDILDTCSTPVGRRLLRMWLEQPLLNPDDINDRLDAVEELKDKLVLRGELRDLLKKVYDLERLGGKLGSGLISPRDLLALKRSLEVLPDIKKHLQDCSSHLLRSLSELNALSNVQEMIEQAIDDNAPLTIKEGSIIKKGFDIEIDELKELSLQGKNWLIDFESREKERTGMKYLKVGYNKVFGYFIEISKSNLTLVPDDYIRKQTLVNTERYITEELKIYEEKILNARERLFELEYQAFQRLKEELQPYIAELLKTARDVASVDVLSNLALVAYNNDYVRPQLCEAGSTEVGKIEIRAGRHPVVERSLRDARFVPNDVKLDQDEHRFAIITGPNMGGKSTYMRQVAIIMIMAQMGSFVPADRARISIVDKIFTRVGASDDLAAGQSTFMVEMVELASILNRATPNSLVILDEIGRGTSTYDGLSIAQAVTEFVCSEIRAKTLFATHYHELTSLVESHPGTHNLSVSVVESGETVSFLKKVLPGKADKSYGIHVAKLAGLPLSVISRANEILNSLENQAGSNPTASFSQGSLFEETGSPILKDLASTDIDGLSPKQALDLLYKWKASL